VPAVLATGDLSLGWGLTLVPLLLRLARGPGDDCPTESADALPLDGSGIVPRPIRIYAGPLNLRASGLDSINGTASP
jgi:hypothetical protein